MAFCPERLWHSGKSNHLLVIVPGTTGLGFPVKRGFSYIAGAMWAEGISVYLANTEGQDGRPGEIDMSRWATNIDAEIKSLSMKQGYTKVHFFGTCLGGPVAARCAEQSGSQLLLWETSPAYTPAHREDFLRHCATASVHLADHFWDTLIELRESAARDSRATFLYGSVLQMPFTVQDLSELREHFPEWRFIEIPRADHGLPRGSNPALLPSLCGQITASIFTHK